VTDDATLSDFDAAGDDSDGDSRSDSDDPSVTTPQTAGEIARSTYAWGEYTCAQCGQATDRVWRADGDLVCPDCKAW